MTDSGFKKFLNALEAAGLKYYRASVDTDNHFYNSADSINIYDEGEAILFNVRHKIGTASEGFADPVITQASSIEDIHHVKFGASTQQTIDFLNAYGLTLTDEQKEILVKINSGNIEVNPITGDYILAGFKILSDEEISKLSPVEKAQYEEKLKIYNDREKHIPRTGIEVTIN